MDDQKALIGNQVRQIDNLKVQINDHWSMVQKSVAAARLDEAITLLNAYFQLKEKLEVVEASLAGILRSYFSGQ